VAVETTTGVTSSSCCFFTEVEDEERAVFAVPLAESGC
jgi:hypothetical protein